MLDILLFVLLATDMFSIGMVVSALIEIEESPILNMDLQTVIHTLAKVRHKLAILSLSITINTIILFAVIDCL